MCEFAEYLEWKLRCPTDHHNFPNDANLFAFTQMFLEFCLFFNKIPSSRPIWWEFSFKLQKFSFQVSILYRDSEKQAAGFSSRPPHVLPDGSPPSSFSNPLTNPIVNLAINSKANWERNQRFYSVSSALLLNFKRKTPINQWEMAGYYRV